MVKNNSRQVPRVVHFIWSVPHYRRPVFQRLSDNPSLDFIVCAGVNKKMFGGADVAIVPLQNDRDKEMIKIHCVRSRRMKWKLFRYFEWQPGAVSFLLSRDFDAVICLGNKSFSNFLIRLICKVKRIPLLEWTQGVKRPETGIKWLALKRIYDLADVLLLYGTRARDFFAANGFDASRLYVVNNSLDFERQVEARENMPGSAIVTRRKEFNAAQNDERLIFFSGRLEKRCNLVFLFDALKISRGKNRRIQLVVIGDGSCRQEFVDSVHRLGIQDWVVFFGACYDEAVLAEIMMAADLCVIPGPVGLTAIHSLVYGTPVLARTDWSFEVSGKRKNGRTTFFEHGPEIEAVRKGVTGDFFDEDNVNSLVNKLESMLYPVPCKLQMEDACKRVVEDNYTPEFQENVIISALNSVLSEDKRIQRK